MCVCMDTCVAIDKKVYSKRTPFGHSTHAEVCSVLVNVPSRVHAKGIVSILFDRV